MIEVGRFCIVGDWDNTPVPDNKLKITIPPLGHIYGAGWHDTTKMALLALQHHVKSGESFLELGAGSCILSIAAEKLGASPCYATECSPEALEAGRRVLEANGSTVQLVDGTFLEHDVDLAVVSISTKFAEDNRDKIRARKILVVHDDAHIEVLNG